jgi:hypothetical protein
VAWLAQLSPLASLAVATPLAASLLCQQPAVKRPVQPMLQVRGA